VEPSREGALVDLLDRALVRGVILHADLIISVADVPLIGVNLRAAIAGMKTMLDYGMMQAWDEEIRQVAVNDSEEDLTGCEEENIIHKTYVSFKLREGQRSIWQHAHLILSERKLLLMRKKPFKKFLELEKRKIKKIRYIKSNYLGNPRKTLLIRYNLPRDTGEIQILSSDLNVLDRRLRKAIKHPKAVIPS